MNLFLHFSAHDNCVSRLIDRIALRNRGVAPGFLETAVKLSGAAAGYMTLAFCGIFDFVLNRIPVKKGCKPFIVEQAVKVDKPGISVIIVNWNGEKLLASCLHALYPALDAAGVGYEVIVADNGSVDNSLDILKNEFPEVRVLNLKKNLGFGAANNLAVKMAEYNLLLFLNNDIILHSDTLKTLLGHFSDPLLFAVAPKALQPDGRVAEGHSWCELSDDGPAFYNERQFPSASEMRKTAPTLYAFGACAIVRKEIFLGLGGFDSLYSPFYWEDNDLSYMALKRGYKVLYDPSVTVIHEHGASSRRLSPYYILAIMEKNATLFFLKNITDRALSISVRAGLRRKIQRAVQERDYARLVAFSLVAVQLPGMLKKRFWEKYNGALTDAEIMEMTRNARQH